VNTIQTLGDLKKALSVYPDELPVKFRSPDLQFRLNNDTQIALVRKPIVDGSAAYTEISLIPEPVISRKPVFVGFESPTNSSGETMNYKLLRPFDLEAAKAGAKITDKTEIEHTFAAEAGPDGDMAVRDPQGNVFVMDLSEARMVPLAWVEGKPVYPGDVLYWSAQDKGAEFVKKMVEYADGTADKLRQQNRELKDALIQCRVLACPGTDQRPAVERNFPEL